MFPCQRAKTLPLCLTFPWETLPAEDRGRNNHNDAQENNTLHPETPAKPQDLKATKVSARMRVFLKAGMISQPRETLISARTGWKCFTDDVEDRDDSDLLITWNKHDPFSYKLFSSRKTERRK